jgi:hypothetical protein
MLSKHETTSRGMFVYTRRELARLCKDANILLAISSAKT